MFVLLAGEEASAVDSSGNSTTAGFVCDEEQPICEGYSAANVASNNPPTTKGKILSVIAICSLE